MIIIQDNKLYINDKDIEFNNKIIDSMMQIIKVELNKLDRDISAITLE